MWNAYKSLEALSKSVTDFYTSLYHQKPAFYFREVKQWDDCLKVIR